jgi:hypothetical protein
VSLVLQSSALRGQVKPATPSPGGSGVIPLPERPRIGSVTPLDTVENPNVKKVFAIGIATVFNGNVSAARQAALQSAYAEAVAMGAGTEIGRLTLIRNVQAVTDVVSSRSRGFVKSYEVVRDQLVPGTPPQYEVRISAEVVTKAQSVADELDGLRLFLEIIGSPRILILLPDRDVTQPEAGRSASESTQINVGGTTSSPSVSVSSTRQAGTTPAAQPAPEPAGTMRAAEAAVAAAFAKFGYPVSTSDDLVSGGKASAEQLARARSGVTADAIAVARAAGADLLLTGMLRTATQRVSPAGVEFVSATTEASAKALVVSNGHVVDAFHKTVTKAHVSALGAVSMSMDAIATDFATTLAWKIPSILAARPRVTKLVVANVSFGTAERIKANLEKVEGVDVVRFASVPTASSRTAELELLSGYVSVPQDELLNHCIETAGPVQVKSSDKYTLSVSVL